MLTSLFRPFCLGLLLTAGVAFSAETRTIAVIPKGTTHDFWKSVLAGARKAEAENPGFKIVWQGPLREDDRQSQIQLVESHVAKGTDAIVLAPLDSRSLRNPVRGANTRKIPVVIIDSDLDRNGVELVSFVATDNHKGGELAAQRMVELLHGKGNVIVLRYNVGSASTEAREQGFLDEIAKHPEIKVLSDNQYAGATQEDALKKAGSLLNGLKAQQIDGVFCPNESSTLGMLRALIERGLAGKVKFVGFDASAKLLEGLRAGQIQGLVVQNPYKMGYEGVKAAIAALNAQPVANRIDTGAKVITQENLDTPEIKALINPAGK
jgi:ribose transport system substrate-binding protein